MVTRSADKKPELYTDPITGKRKIRMVSVNKEVVKESGDLTLFSNRQLYAIMENPTHPLRSAARGELALRRMKAHSESGYFYATDILIENAFASIKLSEQKSQVTVGSYTTKHFDICPSAVELYSNISGKTQMTHLIVETMMLQDLLFRLEKQLIAQGSADEEDVEKAEHFGDMIMDNAEQMDLVDEHSYIDDVHLAKIRQLAGEEDDEDEEDEEDEMNEKTLTPAELKKREEIAKAIKRENPNMPMAKKMAIATATAKKVAEARIVTGGYRDATGKYIPGKTADDIAREKASKKREAMQKTASVIRKEEVEQIDEISTDLAHDVYKKRAAQAQSLGKQSGDEPDIKKANVLARAGYKAQKKADNTHLRMIKKILKRPS